MPKEDEISNGAKHIELKKKGDEDVHTVGTPSWLRFNIELEKPIDVLEKKVDIGLEEPIDVVDDEVEIENSGKKLHTHFDSDVTEIEPFSTKRPHVWPARKKRASVYLSTPFTTLPKRYVTTTTTISQCEPIVYDHMHKILDVHLDRLRAWITDKRTDDEVRETFHGKKSKIFFRDLFMCRRWLADENLNALFLFIRLKIKAVGIPFAQNFTTADTILFEIVTLLYRILVAKWPIYKECIKDNRLFDWEEEYRLVDYVVGSKEDFEDPWASVDYVYSPFNVWDSLPSLTTAEKMTNILLPIQELVPKLLDSTGFFDRRGRSSTYKEPWPVIIVDSIPLQRNNSDCGVFTIKYFEYIAAGVGLDTLCQENMSYFRKQLAFHLWTNTPIVVSEILNLFEETSLSYMLKIKIFGLRRERIEFFVKRNACTIHLPLQPNPKEETLASRSRRRPSLLPQSSSSIEQISRITTYLGLRSLTGPPAWHGYIYDLSDSTGSSQPDYFSVSSGFATDQYVLGAPSGHRKPDPVSTGAHVARVRERASYWVQAEVRARARWRTTRSDREEP
uniref:Ubiquitin-like protease family profile domain-containing protein n=1 Tax=Cucumis melo TaxID=3656 RepID=A0A9I9E6S1_CUCME